MAERTRVMFLCSHNECRSQTAGGWARHLRPDLIDRCSAGIGPHVMKEVGVDISGQRSKRSKELLGVPLDYVVAGWDQANEHCPVFPRRVEHLDVGFDDPWLLAKSEKSGKEALGHYRRVRAEIRALAETLPQAVGEHDEQ